MKILASLNLVLAALLLVALAQHAVQAQDTTETAGNEAAAAEPGYDSSYSPAPTPDGAVVRVDIPTEDLDESREFYEKAFGWTFREGDEVSDRYIYWQDPAGYTGGLSKFIKPGEGNGVVLYLHSDDLDESMKRINRAGGKAFDFSMAIENGKARVALFNDPQGNLMGLISPQD